MFTKDESNGSVCTTTSSIDAKDVLEGMDAFMQSLSNSFSLGDDDDNWEFLRSSIRDLDFSDHGFFDNEKWLEACEQLDKSFGGRQGLEEAAGPVSAMMDSFSDLVRHERAFSPTLSPNNCEKMERLARMRDFILQFNAKNGIPPLSSPDKVAENGGTHRRLVPLEGESSSSQPLSTVLHHALNVLKETPASQPENKSAKKSQKKTKKESEQALRKSKNRVKSSSPSKRRSQSPSKKSRSKSPSKKSRSVSPSKQPAEISSKRRSETPSDRRKSKSPSKQRRGKSSERDMNSSATKQKPERSAKKERSSRNLVKSSDKESSTRSLLKSSGRASRGRAGRDGNSSSRESSSRRLGNRTSRERGERQSSKRDLLASDHSQRALQKALQVARDRGEKEGSRRRILSGGDLSNRQLSGSVRNIISSEISNPSLRQALQKTLDKEQSFRSLKKQPSDRADDSKADDEKSPDTVAKGASSLMLTLKVRLANQLAAPSLAQDTPQKAPLNQETPQKSSLPSGSLRSSMDKSRSSRNLRRSAGFELQQKSMSARQLRRTLDTKASKTMSASAHADLRRSTMMDKSSSSSRRKLHRTLSTEVGKIFNSDDDMDGRIVESSGSSRKLRSSSEDESGPKVEQTRPLQRHVTVPNPNELSSSFRRPRRASLDLVCGSTQNISMAPVVQLRSSDDEGQGRRKTRPGLQRQTRTRKLQTTVITTGECSEEFEEPCFGQTSGPRGSCESSSDDSSSRNKAGSARWSDSEERTNVKGPVLVRQVSSRKVPVVESRRGSMGKPPLSTGGREVSFDDFVTDRSSSFRGRA